MDFYQEQHSYTLARNANANSDEETDEDTSWVMMSRDGEVIKLPGEKIYYKVRSRIGLDVSTPKALPNATPFSIKSDGGIVYVTNNRVRAFTNAKPGSAGSCQRHATSYITCIYVQLYRIEAGRPFLCF